MSTDSPISSLSLVSLSIFILSSSSKSTINSACPGPIGMGVSLLGGGGIAMGVSLLGGGGIAMGSLPLDVGCTVMGVSLVDVPS